MLYDAKQLRQSHERHPETKTVVLRRCWSVIFDCNGNAPGNAVVASCATEELANQVLTMVAAQKNDDKTPALVVDGKQHYGLPCYSVEGYEFDTYYAVEEDWQPDESIICSLAELTKVADYEEDSSKEEGAYLLDEEPG